MHLCTYSEQQLLTFAHWWFSRPISILLTIPHLISYQIEIFVTEMDSFVAWLESSVLYKTIVKRKPGALSHSCCKKHKCYGHIKVCIGALILDNLRLQTGGL